jgi:hypothetical protein
VHAAYLCRIMLVLLVANCRPGGLGCNRNQLLVLLSSTVLLLVEGTACKAVTAVIRNH